MKSFSVVYEDQYLIVVNKSSGCLVVPTPKNERYTLTNLVNQYLAQSGNYLEARKSKESSAESSCIPKAYPCHRLDRDTSGLVIYAKDRTTLKKMEEAFKARKVKKKYLAYVRGCPVKKEGSIRYPIEGQSAQTYYRLLKTYQGFSVLEVEPVTGRTNQIRIHLAKIGHPILGERKFAFGKDFPVKFPRLALHAQEIQFIHPVTGKALSFSVPPPPDMNISRVRYSS